LSQENIGGLSRSVTAAMNDLSTRFVLRLRQSDAAAWWELFEMFGPVLRQRFDRWGNGFIGDETVRDLSQQTLAALAQSMQRHDPSRSRTFASWLLAIARHTLNDELDRRSAQKRGEGRRPQSLDEEGTASREDHPDVQYEQAIFRAKVVAALRRVEKESDFLAFSVFRMRVLEQSPSAQVATELGLSEAAVSRRLTQVRDRLRAVLEEVIETFSFSDEEKSEAQRKGLLTDPNPSSSRLFDEAVSEIYRRQIDATKGDS
jgi:RNA polymerase sigma factor (sigma-70 family)